MMAKPALVVDRTHLGRRASGIERITEELFSDEALRSLPVEGFSARGGGRLAIAAAQMAQAPLAMMARPATLWAFSGFPPSPLAVLFRDRAVMYVHDMFLITRRQDLNRAAKVCHRGGSRATPGPQGGAPCRRPARLGGGSPAARP